MTRAYVPAYERHRAVPATGVRVVWALCAMTVLAQISYPLVERGSREPVTATVVVLFLATSVAHAALHRGVAWAAAFVLVAAGCGLLAEAVGLATGLPFGSYAYGDGLGSKLLGVPALVPLAWAMFAYPAFLVGRRLAGGRRLVAWLVGAVALASWDVFLDPQMVAEGYWRWDDPTPALPGVPGIPLSNYAGWLLVSAVLMGLLGLALPDRSADDGVPAVLFLWTYASSVLANAVFFDRPGVAFAGGIAMGVVAVPYAVSLWRERP